MTEHVQSVLLVIAHPDDEAMFFVPTLRWLQARGIPAHILCLSNGGYQGLGKTRKKELKTSLDLVFQWKSVSIVDSLTLQDGPDEAWDPSEVAEKITLCCNNQNLEDLSHIITFDHLGVSTHVNHIDTYLGVRHYLDLHPSLRGLKLHSNRGMLYSSILGAGFLFLLQSGGVRVFEYNCLYGLQAMYAHKSQFVWYRVLFVIFSVCTYVNVLERIE